MNLVELLIKFDNFNDFVDITVDIIQNINIVEIE